MPVAIPWLKAHGDPSPKSINTPGDSQLLFAGERVTDMARVWEIASDAKRKELLRELMRSVRLDAKEESLRIEPWPEYEPLFSVRREFVELGTPGWTRTTDL